MPFTLSHVAAVLPLRNRWKLIWPALVAGSMAPDFEYFVLGAPRTRIFHTFPGVIIYTVPLALLVLWLTHEVMCGSFFDLLPAGINSRFTPRKLSYLNPRQLAAILLSVAIGIATHIAWDSFTHEDTMITNRVSWEHTQLPVPGVGEREMYKVLQWTSSIVGLAILAMFFVVWYRRTTPRAISAQRFRPNQKVAAWIAMLIVAVGVAYLRAIMLFPAVPVRSRGMIVGMIVSAMAALFWEVLAFSVFQRIRKQGMIRARQASQRSGAVPE